MQQAVLSHEWDIENSLPLKQLELNYTYLLLYSREVIKDIHNTRTLFKPKRTHKQTHLPGWDASPASWPASIVEVDQETKKFSQSTLTESGRWLLPRHGARKWSWVYSIAKEHELGHATLTPKRGACICVNLLQAQKSVFPGFFYWAKQIRSIFMISIICLKGIQTVALRQEALTRVEWKK